MTISFNTFAKIEKVASAGRQGSKLSSGKKGGGGGEGTTGSVVEDSVAEDTGTQVIVDDVDTKVDVAAKEDTGLSDVLSFMDMDRREKARKQMMSRRGGQSLGKKQFVDDRSYYERFMDPQGSSIDLSKLTDTRRIDRRMKDAYSDQKMSRGVEFAGSGLTAAKLRSGVENINRKLDGFTDSDGTKKVGAVELFEIAQKEHAPTIDRAESAMRQLKLILEKYNVSIDSQGNPVPMSTSLSDSRVPIGGKEFGFGGFDVKPQLTPAENRLVQSLTSRSSAGPTKAILNEFKELSSIRDVSQKALNAAKTRVNELEFARDRFEPRIKRLEKLEAAAAKRSQKK